MESIREIRDIPRQFTTNIRHQATKQASSELQGFILTNFFLLLVIPVARLIMDRENTTYMGSQRSPKIVATYRTLSIVEIRR